FDAETLDFAPHALRRDRTGDDFARYWRVPAGDQPPVRGNQVDQQPEDSPDRVQIRINIRVVVFDVVQNNQVGNVVQELRPFVEIGRVVFIAFDHEVIRVCDFETRAEILGYPADQKRRFESPDLHYPGHQRGRGRFAVRARDDRRVSSADEVLADDFGHRDVAQFVVERVFDLGVPARRGVADDNDVRRRPALWLQMEGVEAFESFYSESLQLVTHPPIEGPF